MKKLTRGFTLIDQTRARQSEAKANLKGIFTAKSNSSKTRGR